MGPHEWKKFSLPVALAALGFGRSGQFLGAYSLIGKAECTFMRQFNGLLSGKLIGYNLPFKHG